MPELKAFADNIIVRIAETEDLDDYDADVLAGSVVSIGPMVDDGYVISEGSLVLFTDFTELGGGFLSITTDDIVAIKDDIPSNGRYDIYGEIDTERTYQDLKWGGPDSDDKQSPADWVKYIVEYAQGAGRAQQYGFRTRMLKVAALAVAAIEAEGRRFESSAMV